MWPRKHRQVNRLNFVSARKEQDFLTNFWGLHTYHP